MNETDILEHQTSLVTKCISLHKNFRVKRTDEALQQLREAENVTGFIICITKKQKRRELRNDIRNKVK